MKYGLIAGNGRFPILALQSARKTGDEVVVFAIKEEASQEVEQLATRCHWISLGSLSKLINLCHDEHITQVMMAGQVKHVSIFSSIQPDWRLVKLLAALQSKSTTSLIGGVAKVLAGEGIELVESTHFLQPLLAAEGVLTKRKPSKDELSQIEYGRRVANALAGFDIGQSVAICDRACVAVEAMEGTDAMLRRAAQLVNGKPLILVKVSTGRKHMLFDVPVVGPETIRTLRETGATALAIDAGRTLLLDREELIELANQNGISIIAAASSA
jgi:DUF1009 family protein